MNAPNRTPSPHRERREESIANTQLESPRFGGPLGIGLALVFAIAAFFSGIQIGTNVGDGANMQAGLFSFFMAPSAAPDEDASLSNFWRVWNLLEEKFVASTASSTAAVSEDERVYGAIQGLVRSYGDPYTVFLPPADASQFEQDIAGNFGGVGMEVGLRDGLVTVIAPLPNTPAAKAGIVAGDVIVEIDEKTTENMTIEEAVRLIRGEKGTEVLLTIYRENETEFLEIMVVRDTITIPTVETEQVGDTFIIRLYSFNALAEMRMQEELRNFIRSDADKLILDLRGNPGGYLQGAVAIGSYFLPTGAVIVREHFGENEPDQVYRSSGRVVHAFNPDNMVVLVNGGSASAAEILAGALKEHEVATLIGERTFGKGSVQELVPLADGSSLKVTIARWLTPDGTSFSEVGLEPNVTVLRTPQQVVEGADPQQEAALEWLQGNRDIGSESVSSIFSTETAL